MNTELETYSLQPLKEDGFIGKFTFHYFELREDYPLHDTIVEVKKWLEEIRPGDGTFVRGDGIDASLYVKHHDLTKSFKQMYEEGGYIIHYFSGVKHVTEEEMSSIYPYTGPLDNSYASTRKER